MNRRERRRLGHRGAVPKQPSISREELDTTYRLATCQVFTGEALFALITVRGR